MCLLQSSRGVLLPQHISRVSYIYFLFLFRFGVFLASAHVQTDTYAPDLYEKTGAYLDVFFLKIAPRGSREEKSLRHVAMVAKFLDDNKQKTSFKKWIRTVLNLIDYIECHFICQMLANFQGLNSKGTYLSLEKEKDNFCVVFTYSIMWAREIRKSHVAVE